MAALMLRVPHETARLLSEVQYGDVGERESPGEYHITVTYLGKEIPIEQITKAIPIIFGITSKTRPFTVGTDHISTFPPGEDGVPIIARVNSPELHTLRDALWAAFDAAGIPYDKKFPEFKPHVTVGYSKDPLAGEVVNADFPRIEWGAHELILWGADRGDGRLSVTFPFSVSMARAASVLNRAYVKLASYSQSKPAPVAENISRRVLRRYLAAL
jgi:2'-5' RNA ligase